MIKILDKYLIKQYVQTIVFGILAFTLIFVVIDMMENLDDFIDQNVNAAIILNYYLVFTPEIIRLITPVSVLFAALFTAGKTANLSELTAIRASGVSLFRFMLPFILTTILVVMISVYFSGFIVPMANKTKIYIEVNYLKKGTSFSGSNIFFQDSKSRIVNIGHFDNSTNKAFNVSIQEFDSNDPTKMLQRTDAIYLTYDSSKSCWMASKGTWRVFHETNQKLEYFTEKELGFLNFKPDDVAKKQQKPEQMNLNELDDYIVTQSAAGNDTKGALIEYHSRFAFAAASLIVVLFGLPISANKRKGGLAAQIGLNILVTFIYLVFMKISQAFGKNGSLDPVLTAWLANIIFLLAALINLPRIKS